MSFISHRKGFTLIELLVVISIISLLSSIVIASLSSARAKAVDTAIFATAKEVKSVLELHRNGQSNYSGLIPGWVDTCGVGSFSGTYAVKMRELCLSIVSKTEGSTSNGQDDIYIGSPQSVNTNSYTIIIRLPYQSRIAGASRYLCIGANGGNSSSVTFGPWTQSGCYSDPSNQ